MTTGTTLFERKIPSFHGGHPEFAVLVKEKDQARRIRLDDKGQLKDTARVKLNHQKHLKPGLEGLKDLMTRQGMTGVREGPGGLQLACTYCHQPDGRRAYLAPIRYENHCADCHPLDFDTRLPGTVAPHDKPLIVRAFLREVFTTNFEQCQTLKQEGRAAEQAARDLQKRCQELGLIKGEEKEQEARPRGRLGRREEEDAPPSSEQWVASQRSSGEALLFKQRCELCHMLTVVPDRLPEVIPPAMPVRWLPHSTFNHDAHRILACAECHKAGGSQKTADVLLPSIAVCRECHRASGGARSGCVECHLYHDKAGDRDLDGPFTVRELVMGAPPRAVARPARPGG